MNTILAVLGAVLGLSAAAGEPETVAAEGRHVVIESSVDGVELAGSLYSSPGPSPAAGIVLIGVAGPNDRHLSIGRLRPFEAVAERLQQSGITVLTLDDRGVGASGGHWTQADYETLASDARDALAYLEGRPGVDAARTGYFGLSEGSAIALLAAADDGGQADFLILGSPPGLNGEDALGRQLDAMLAASGASTEMAELWRREFRRFMALVRAQDRAALIEFLSGRGRQLVPPYAFVPRTVEGQADLFLSPWYRAQIDYRPSAVLDNVAVPVLILGGALDPVLPPAQHHPALLSRLANAEAVVFDHVNHLLLPARTGLPQEYAQITDAYDPGVLAAMIAWLRDEAMLDPPLDE